MAQRNKQQPIVFYDGTCANCSKAVEFIVQHESGPEFLFCKLGEAATSYIKRETGLAELPDSMIYYEDRSFHFESKAVFKVVEGLQLPWKFFLVFKILPTFLLDGVYRFVARHRHHLSSSASCEVGSSLSEREVVFQDFFGAKDVEPTL